MLNVVKYSFQIKYLKKGFYYILQTHEYNSRLSSYNFMNRIINMNKIELKCQFCYGPSSRIVAHANDQSVVNKGNVENLLTPPSFPLFRRVPLKLM